MLIMHVLKYRKRKQQQQSVLCVVVDEVNDFDECNGGFFDFLLDIISI